MRDLKGRRQAEILRIIREQDVETQEQMLDQLGRRGIRATQATISRDIKELNLVKQPGRDGNYRIVVVKTMPGLAPAAAAALDGMELEGFVGSLAGDDTAILIMRTSRVAEELTREIESMLEG